MRLNKRFHGYLAAPLFNDRERKFNLTIEEALAPLLTMFLPQRDGRLLKNLVSEGLTVPEARRVVFSRDVSAIRDCDVLIAVLDGRTVDEGAAFELGYAHALNKPCIGLKTDDRIKLPSGDNPMIVMGCREICADLDELVSVTRSCLENTALTLPRRCSALS